MNASASPPPFAREPLAALRKALLDLHKALLAETRAGYERLFGPIPSTSALLDLVTADPWFAWLRPLTGLIVEMDELLEADTAPDAETLAALRRRIAGMIAGNVDTEGFARSYRDALQRDPNIAIAHAAVRRTLDALRA
ncbi:MAG: hypothetical protein ABFC67_13500 [Mizugakiibacter sp.]|uniref:hypothetical protein n=1 Tax=Mizugakiibacter sp. TaxID=1972610 RepID=UPI0031BC563A|nr:hypothetical protein [Xanthomonadaceae bacterium]